MLPKDKIYWLKLVFILGFVGLTVALYWQNAVSPTILAVAPQNTIAESNSATNAVAKTVLQHSPENAAITTNKEKTGGEPKSVKAAAEEPLEGCIKCHGNTEPDAPL